MTSTRGLLKDVHKGLLPPIGYEFENVALVKGPYEYYHYVCDGVNDRGYGCGYRTLQTLCSWLALGGKTGHVPSLREIQLLLVDMEDKPKSFLGSREWIGAFEVCLVIEKLFDVPSKIIHVPRGHDIKKHVDILRKHFETFGSPIMCGGDADASSKGIFGVATAKNEEKTFLLVVDPHFDRGPIATPNILYEENWVQWRDIDDFMDSSFYNFCLPQHAFSNS